MLSVKFINYNFTKSYFDDYRINFLTSFDLRADNAALIPNIAKILAINFFNQSIMSPTINISYIYLDSSVSISDFILFISTIASSESAFT